MGLSILIFASSYSRRNVAWLASEPDAFLACPPMASVSLLRLSHKPDSGIFGERTWKSEKARRLVRLSRPAITDQPTKTHLSCTPRYQLSSYTSKHPSGDGWIHPAGQSVFPKSVV